MGTLRRRVTASTVGALALAATAAGLVACQPAPTTYVALGDSYAAGPLILNQSLSPLGCLRSDRNYPHLVRGTIAATKFVDVTCSGATTRHMTQAQGVTPGPNPPQLSAVGADTKVVTLQIGGNDVGFSGIIQNCAAPTPWDAGCRGDYVSGGRDQLAERIAATAPKIDGVLAEIRRRAPQAKVFVVGYPALLPESGGGCWPLVPIVSSDVSYLRATNKALNAMLRERAVAAGARYIDLYSPSIGHDMCSSSRWIEPIVPVSSLAAPVHPNAAGMRAFAQVVRTEIDAVVTS
jgi:lysophospholipase L1-like esterase